MGYLGSVLQAFVSPVNCVAELVQGVVAVGGHFANCVGNNLVSISQTVTNLPL